MPQQNTQVESSQSGNGASVRSNVANAMATVILLGSFTLCPNAMAEDKPDHSMHNMHDMNHMQHMQHMDHSMHEQQMAGKGAYTSTVMSYSVPDLKLVDVNGKSVALRSLLDDGAPVILNFIFTTCTTICPVMTATFQQVQEKLGQNRKEVRMVSISIDPENDSPAKLKEYAAKYKAGAQWTFLTGSLDNSLRVQKAFGVFAGEKMSHKPITFLKAKGSDTQWVRLEGIAEAGQIVDEYTKLGSENRNNE